MTRAREISNVLGRNIESTTFTATANQTAFSITHDAGRIQVYMNGLLLDPTVDWTSNGSTVTLTEGAVAGDELEVVKFDNLAVADAIPRTGHTGTIDFSSATFVPPAGHVIQTVYNDTSTGTNNTSDNSIVGTNLQATIRPRYSDSKIFVLIDVDHQISSGNDAHLYIGRDNGNGTFFNAKTGAPFETGNNFTMSVYRYSGSGGNQVIHQSPFGYFNAGQTTDIIFKLFIGNVGSADSKVGAHAQQRIMLQEIKQ